MTGPTVANGGVLRIALPKGRLEQGVLRLLADAGIAVTSTARSYRPCVSLPDTEAKQLKSQNIVEMLHLGTRDVGFAGADWVAELDARVVELLDTGLDPVRVVAAAPGDPSIGVTLPKRRLVVATEYPKLAACWVQKAGIDAEIVRSYGATEVFPPEDADLIVDNASTGATLALNGMVIVGDVMRSSTRLLASVRALEQPEKRRRIEDLKLLVESVLEARRRVMVEVNATAERLNAVVAVLPCMRQPTVAPLFGDSGFAVKAAVPRDRLAQVIPALKQAGGSDVVVSELAQIVP